MPNEGKVCCDSQFARAAGVRQLGPHGPVDGNNTDFDRQYHIRSWRSAVLETKVDPRAQMTMPVGPVSSDPSDETY
jgi:hypothetical protein